MVPPRVTGTAPTGNRPLAVSLSPRGRPHGSLGARLGMTGPNLAERNRAIAKRLKGLAGRGSGGDYRRFQQVALAFQVRSPHRRAPPPT